MSEKIALLGTGALAREYIGIFGQTPFTVAYVDKDDPAVVTAAMGPSAKSDFLADRLGIKLSAIMGSHAVLGLKDCWIIDQEAVILLPGLGGGATTPIEIMYLSASSTSMSSSITSLFGSIRKNPEVGFGVVGT